MTREEKLEKYLDHQYMYENGDPSYIHGIKVGVSWADENPKSPWISVKDRLPEAEEMVFVSFGDTYVKGVGYLSDEEYWYINGWGCIDDVTHWMPIPELAERVGR